jgi:Domain of unknown function (DUF4900)
MKNSQKTAGVTLVVTVLIVMLLLASVVVVTGQLALSARRSSADQNATLQAQYVAESGLARAQARLTLIKTLMTTALKPNPDTTTTSKMLDWMTSLCAPATVPASGASTLANPTTLCENSTDLLSGVASLDTSSNLDLFIQNIASTDDSINNIVNPYTSSGYPLGANAEADARAFWAKSLKPNGTSLIGNVGGYSANNLSGSFGLALKKVERFGLESYRLTFTLPTILSGTTISGTNRQLNVQGVSKEYTYEISRNSFAEYALFTDHHFASAANEDGCAAVPPTSLCSRVTFTSNTLFSGPVHTNQNFQIQGKPYFAGIVTSAGCPPGKIITAGTPPVESCGPKPPSADPPVDPTPGAYIGGRSGLVAPSEMQGNTPIICSSDTNPCPTGNTPVTPQFQGGVNWGANFQPLPINSNDQALAGQGLTKNPIGSTYPFSADIRGTGLHLGNLKSKINLSVATLSAGSVQGLAGVQKAQIISYTLEGSTTPSQIAVIANLATGVNNAYVNIGGIWKIALQVPCSPTPLQATQTTPACSQGGGNYIDATSQQAKDLQAKNLYPPVQVRPFNGAIYTNAEITSLKGPDRTITDSPNSAPAAIADFAKITIATPGNIHIKNDLKNESPSCSGSNSFVNDVFTPATCNNKNTKNILGLYSSAGDIFIDSPRKYTSSGEGVGKDVTIHAVLMASQGRVTVDGYNAGSANDGLGQVRLLGGLIEKYYGPFGLTDGHGFGRNFVYDPRAAEGISPPYFPIQQVWKTDFTRTALVNGDVTSTETPLKIDGSQTQQKRP